MTGVLNAVVGGRPSMIVTVAAGEASGANIYGYGNSTTSIYWDAPFGDIANATFRGQTVIAVISAIDFFRLYIGGGAVTQSFIKSVSVLDGAGVVRTLNPLDATFSAGATNSWLWTVAPNHIWTSSTGGKKSVTIY